MKRRTFLKIVFSLFLIIGSVGLSFRCVIASDNTYGYDYFTQIVGAPDAYVLGETINPKKLIEKNEEKLTTFYKDVYTDLLKKDKSFIDIRDAIFYKNYLYILTKKGLFIFDLKGNLINAIIKYFPHNSSNLKEDEFNNLQRFTIIDKYLYISDYDISKKIMEKKNGKDELISYGSRIIVFKFDSGNLTKPIYDRSLRLRMDKNIPGISKMGFHPEKIEVDNSGHIYVTCKNIENGLIEIDMEQNFKRFVGQMEVQISAKEAFWHKLNRKKEGRRLYTSTIFSSLSVDKTGFVYATTKTEGDKPVKKFNYKGDDVLIENGSTKVVGDIYKKDNISSFIDIDINDYGVYIILDSSQAKPEKGFNNDRQRIFAYNENGELLYIIGNHSKYSKNHFVNPKVIRWINNSDILVIDTAPNNDRIMIFKQTDYGYNINNAINHYHYGEFQKSLPYWKKALSLNSNNDLAYVGIGKIYYQDCKYEEAKKYFRLGNNKVYYSKAYNKTRNQKLRKIFPGLIITIFILIIGAKTFKLWKKRKQA